MQFDFYGDCLQSCPTVVSVGRLVEQAAINHCLAKISSWMTVIVFWNITQHTCLVSYILEISVHIIILRLLLRYSIIIFTWIIDLFLFSNDMFSVKRLNYSENGDLTLYTDDTLFEQSNLKHSSFQFIVIYIFIIIIIILHLLVCVFFNFLVISSDEGLSFVC